MLVTCRGSCQIIITIVLARMQSQNRHRARTLLFLKHFSLSPRVPAPRRRRLIFDHSTILHPSIHPWLPVTRQMMGRGWLVFWLICALPERMSGTYRIHWAHCFVTLSFPLANPNSCSLTVNSRSKAPNYKTYKFCSNCVCPPPSCSQLFNSPFLSPFTRFFLSTKMLFDLVWKRRQGRGNSTFSLHFLLLFSNWSPSSSIWFMKCQSRFSDLFDLLSIVGVCVFQLEHLNMNWPKYARTFRCIGMCVSGQPSSVPRLIWQVKRPHTSRRRSTRCKLCSQF